MMNFTFSQKKHEMAKHIETYFGPLLRKNGFASYKNEGFFWYKIENEILYKILFPIWPTQPFVSLQVCYGAAPLFAWEHIPPDIHFQNWFFETRASDRCIWAESEFGHMAAKQLLGSLPRESYYIPRITHPNENGLLIDHLNTDLCGAEILPDMIFPVFSRLTTAEEVFKWHKDNKRLSAQCTSDKPGLELKTEEDYIAYMSSRILAEDGGSTLWDYSLTFADECLFYRDEKYYPLILNYLKYKMERPPIKAKTKELCLENEKTGRHVRLLLEMIESGDFGMLDAELSENRERMLAQIGKKLPELIVQQEKT